MQNQMSSRCLKLLNKCKNITQLKQAHGLAITCGLGVNPFALSRLLAFCSDPFHGSLYYAHKIFIQIHNPTLCIYNTMIKTYLLKDENFRALEVYTLILENGMCPDNYTLPYALKACANIKGLNLGRSIHGHGVQLGLGFDNFVGNGLISLYSSFGEMGFSKCAFDEISWPCVISWTVLICGYGKKGDAFSARLVFDEAPVKDRGIWGAMLSAYVQNNCFKEGIGLFRLMQMSGIEPDEASLVSVLCACAHLGCLEIGKWVHRYVESFKIPVGGKLGNALINMYSKCGRLDLAEKVFDKMPDRDIVCWNSMISGYAMNGNGVKAIALFHAMGKSGVPPDSVTFISLFSACSHSGMVYEGLKFLRIMCDGYNIVPQSEHYGCIIDLLSRARLLEEANDVIQRMPVENGPGSGEEAIAWRALLNAWCSHGRVDLADAAAERVVALERHSGAYVLLSNSYAAAGRHTEAQRIRRAMRMRGVEKTPGCSLVEIDGVGHEFIAGEKTHCNIEQVCVVLESLMKQIEYIEHGSINMSNSNNLNPT